MCLSICFPKESPPPKTPSDSEVVYGICGTHMLKKKSDLISIIFCSNHRIVHSLVIAILFLEYVLTQREVGITNATV